MVQNHTPTFQTMKLFVLGRKTVQPFFFFSLTVALPWLASTHIHTVEIVLKVTLFTWCAKVR